MSPLSENETSHKSSTFDPNKPVLAVMGKAFPSFPLREACTIEKVVASMNEAEPLLS